MNWSDFLFGVILSVIPAIFTRWLAQRYSIYLAKLGYAKPVISVITLILIACVAFSCVSLVVVLYVWIFGPEEPIWARPGALFGILVVFLLLWAHIIFRVARIQAGYFIEYTFPKYHLIFGVPALAILAAVGIFMQMGLMDLIAESMAVKLKFPQFCRLVTDRDSCYRSFYIDHLGQYKKVQPKVCRNLEGRHFMDCTIQNHENSPDFATCKLFKARNRDSSAVYFWCLSYLPSSPERIDSCRRVEGSFRWPDIFFGNCINAENIGEQVTSTKSIAMHFLDFQENLNSPSYRKRFKIPEGLMPRMDFPKLLQLDPQIEHIDREGKTLLFYIHQPRDLDALLKRKPKLFVQDENGITAPMHWVSRERPERYLPLIEKIVAAGYDIDHVDSKRGRTLLTHYITSLKSRTEEERESDQVVNFVKTLLKMKANPFARDKTKKRATDYAAELKLKRVQELFKHKSNL